MKIDQYFESRPDGRYLLQKCDVLGDFGITKTGTGLFGERTVSYKDFKTNEPIDDSVFRGNPTVVLDSAETHQEGYWTEYRHDTLTRAESKVYANVDRLQHMKTFRSQKDWGTQLHAGNTQ